jgi:CheY-like chemotaxis protein
VIEQATKVSDNQLSSRQKSFALLVDGHVRDLFTTGRILQRLDYDIYIVSTAEDAIKMIEAATPALVITELALPQMSGLELLVRIKHDPKTKSIPVIIHTASDDPNREKLCRASGCASYLNKPVEPDVLYITLQQASEATPRQYIRMRTLLPARVGGTTAPGDAMSTEYVSELSENGIFLCTLRPRPIKTVLGVTILIHSMPVKVKAVVLRCVTIGAGQFREPGMGMRFESISPTDRELIRNFIKGQIIKDIPTQ